MYIVNNKKYLFVWCITLFIINICSCAFNHRNDNGMYKRLSDDIKPLSYSIELTPYFPNENLEKQFTFDGYSQIVFRPTHNNVTEITLHMFDLSNITHILNTKSSSRQSSTIKNATYDASTDQYTIFLDKPMNALDEYTLTLKYGGILKNDWNRGFYCDSYTEHNATKWFAASHMENIYARRVFPCFDEPHFKAQFQMIINRPMSFQPTISNTRIENTEIKSIDGTSYVRETFEMTPPMSTFSVSFIISEFKCRQNDDKTFEVCSRPDVFDQTLYAFNIGQKLLQAYDNLFKLPYLKTSNIGKLTLVVVPKHIITKGWGLITYSENFLLCDPKALSAKDKQDIASVVAIKLVNQWFGDLVTCDSWRQWWLSEGFATFFKYIAIDLVEPDMSPKQSFIIEQIHTSLSQDSYDIPEHTNALNDVISAGSYNKGASIVRMLQHLVGNNNFMTALTKYLDKNKFGTAMPETLFVAMQSEVDSKIDLNIAQIMNNWIMQPGYPLLYVEVNEDRTSAHITQKRFLLENVTHGHDDNSKWDIPITYAHSTENADFSNTRPSSIFPSESSTHVINFEKEIDWLILNVQQTGYYRVNYDKVTRSKINNILYNSPSDIHVLNRVQLIDDSLQLAAANQLSYDEALSTVRYLANETDSVAWISAFNNFNHIFLRCDADQVLLFKKFVLRLMNNFFNEIGFHPKTHTTPTVYNHNKLIRYACQYGHKECVKSAEIEFEKVKAGNYSVPADLTKTVYCTAIKEGSDDEWEFLWNKFKKENDSAKRYLMLDALGCTTKPELIKKYLDLVLTDNVQLLEKHSALFSIIQQKENVNVVLDYLLENEDSVDKAFEETGSKVATLLSYLDVYQTTTERYEKIKRYANKLEQPSTRLNEALRKIDQNLKWAETNMPIIMNFIKQFMLE